MYPSHTFVRLGFPSKFGELAKKNLAGSLFSFASVIYDIVVLLAY